MDIVQNCVGRFVAAISQYIQLSKHLEKLMLVSLVQMSDMNQAIRNKLHEGPV
jgi:hypothetical protein